MRSDNGEVLLDRYGEPEYGVPVVLKCRREQTTKDVQTANGAVLRSYTVYYLDEAQVIRSGDKIDGRTVLAVTEYTNERGESEGFEAYA